MAFLNDNPEVMEWLSENTDFENLDLAGLIQKLVSFISNSLTSIADKALQLVIGLSTGIFNGVLSFVFALYCLARKEILARQGRRLLYAIVPEKIADEVVRILRMSNSTFSNFISGQCLEAVILGLMFTVCMTIFGMPYMPLVSVTIAVTALVPIVGAFVGCIVGAFFILIDSPVLAFWFVIMFLILQQIEGNLIYPKVVGTSIGLPGMWVLVAVAVGGDLMGVAGMLLMIPLASVLYALAREFTDKRLAAKGIEQEKLQAQLPILKSEFKEKRKKTKEKREKKKRIKEKPQEQPKAEPEVIHEETTEEILTEVSEEATGEDEE
jgi:predicted PurR-regulated permease PerM